MTNRILAFVGSYADAADPSLYACTFDPETGELQVTDRVSGLRNPTFLDLDYRSRRLYALEELKDAEGVKRGGAAAFAIDAEAGKLRLLNREQTVEAPVCHITLDRTCSTLFLASYHGGLIGVAAVLEDGRVGSPLQSVKHTGSSVHPNQTQARVHSVTVDRNNRFAAVCDLGADLITLYRIEEQGQRLERAGEVRTAPGAGPRHFAFHPALPYAYVINELNSTINAYRYDGENGTLAEIESVSTLPSDYAGDNATADIHISPDGRFLYGSNRGHDSIAVYAVDASTGKLASVEHTPTGGGHPRNFGLSPDGRFLLAANRDGDNIVTFVRDAETGRLMPNGRELKVPKPVCIKFMPV